MQAAGLVDRIIREHADDILDSDKAVRRVEAERHSQLASARVRFFIKPFVLYFPVHFQRAEVDRSWGFWDQAVSIWMQAQDSDDEGKRPNRAGDKGKRGKGFV